MGSSKDAVEDAISEFKTTRNPKVAAAKVAAKVIVRSLTSPTIVDAVLLYVFTICPVGLAVGVAIFAQSCIYKEHFNGNGTATFFTARDSTGSSQQTSSQCYTYVDSHTQYALRISARGNRISGVVPRSHAEVGQISTWIDTGLVTTGDPLEVSVTGEWYPWGYQSSATTQESIKKLSPALSIEKLGQVSEYQYHNEYVSHACKLSTNQADITELHHTNSDFDVSMRQNHISKYALNSTPNTILPLEQQLETILDSGCYLNKGHGIYLKIGDAQYAYHLANQEIEAFEQVLDRHNRKLTKRQYYDSTGQTSYYTVPFSLPTRIYNQEFSYLNGGAGRLNARLTPATLDNTPYVELAQRSDCGDSLEERLARPNELCPPPKKQKVYLVINDVFYTPNDGEVEVSFASGVEPETSSYSGGISAPKTSIIQSIAFFIVDPLFGKQDTARYKPGTLVDVANKENGIIITVRNSILRNFWFQSVRIVITILAITLYGYDIIAGRTELKFNKLLKRGIGICIGLWGTEPNNYELVDEIIIPFFFQGLNSLFAVLFSAASSITGMSISVSNPFSVFDVMVETIVSPVVGYKILAGFSESVFFWLTIIPLFQFMSVFIISAFRAFFIAMLGVVQTGLLISILPIALVLMINESTAKYIKKFIDKMEQNIVSTMFFLFLMTLVFFLALAQFNKAMSFSICWKEIYSVTIFKIFKISIYGWKIVSAFNIIHYLHHLITFCIATYMCTMADSIMSQVANLLEGTGLYSEGNALLNNFLGAVTDIAQPVSFLAGLNRLTGYTYNYANAFLRSALTSEMLNPGNSFGLNKSSHGLGSISRPGISSKPKKSRGSKDKKPTSLDKSQQKKKGQIPDRSPDQNRAEDTHPLSPAEMRQRVNDMNTMLRQLKDIGQSGDEQYSDIANDLHQQVSNAEFLLDSDKLKDLKPEQVGHLKDMIKGMRDSAVKAEFDAANKLKHRIKRTTGTDTKQFKDQARANKLKQRIKRPTGTETRPFQDQENADQLEHGIERTTGTETRPFREQEHDPREQEHDLDIAGVSNEIEGVQLESDTDLVESQSSLSENVVEQIDSSNRAEAEEASRTEQQQRIEDADAIKRKRQAKALQVECNTLLEYIESAQKHDSSSQAFTDSLGNIIASVDSLQDFAKQNNIRVEFDSGNLNADTKRSDFLDATNTLASQSNIMGMLFTRQSQKKPTK